MSHHQAMTLTLPALLAFSVAVTWSSLTAGTVCRLQAEKHGSSMLNSTKPTLRASLDSPAKKLTKSGVCFVSNDRFAKDSPSHPTQLWAAAPPVLPATPLPPATSFLHFGARNGSAISSKQRPLCSSSASAVHSGVSQFQTSMCQSSSLWPGSVAWDLSVCS